MKINLFPHAKDCNVIGTISIEDYINYIKEGYDVEQIIKARNYGKGTDAYTKIKEKRNAVCFNYLFNKYKTNDNIISSTGMLFYDIDDTSFTLDMIDMSKVFIAHCSFGGNGYSLIVKVDGVTKENYKEAYINIAHQLGITSKYDLGARKRTQFTLMSYDPNIIVNNDCDILIPNINKVDITPIDRNKKVDITYIDRIRIEEVENKGIGGNVHFLKLKFKMELEVYNEDCVFIKDGLPYYECFLPFTADGRMRKLYNGDKHKYLTMYLNNLICLNPTISHKQASVMLRSVVNSSCAEPVSEMAIESMIQYAFGKLNKGELYPVGVKIKRYWVNPALPKQLKFDAYNDKRKQGTIDALDNFIGCDLLNLEVKCTNVLIAEALGVNEKTIRRRLTDEHKHAIKQFNLELKGSHVPTPIIEVEETITEAETVPVIEANDVKNGAYDIVDEAMEWSEGITQNYVHSINYRILREYRISLEAVEYYMTDNNIVFNPLKEALIEEFEEYYKITLTLD